MSPCASNGGREFPKRKSRSIPSIHAADWGCSLMLWPKIEHILLNSWPFEAAFSGIARFLCSAGGSIFFKFYFCRASTRAGEMARGSISHDRCRIPDFGRQNDRNSDTKHKIQITHLFMHYMTTNTVHTVSTHILK